jgi:hypothetical protein
MCGQVTLEACNYCTDGETWCAGDEDCPEGHTCQFITDYDEFHDVWANGSDTCGCVEELGSQLGCNDEGCAYWPMSGPATLTLAVAEEQCYTLRIGGWGGDEGTGQFRITADLAECVSPQRPMPEPCGEACGPDTCLSDADCANTASCIPAPIGEPGPGICYAPKNRYLSIAAHPQQAPNTARRLSCVTGEIVGWLDAPSRQRDESYVSIVPEPVYVDAWPEIVHVYAAEIGPGQAFKVQAIPAGWDIGNEANYSEPLELPTVTLWGDVAGSDSTPGFCTPPDGVVDGHDVDALSGGMQGPWCPLTWADLDPEIPNGYINLDDVLAAAQATQGVPYPWSTPCPALAKRPMPEPCGPACGDLHDACMNDEECRRRSHCVLPPANEPGVGVCYAPKQRYLSIAGHPEQTANTARRVSLEDGPVLGWVGEPYENQGLTLAPVIPSPVYMPQWPGILHVTDCEIAPSYAYDIQAIQQGQDIGDEANYSEALTLHTPAKRGDCIGTCPGDVCEPPNGVASLDDIMAKIKKFQAINVAPLTWLDDAPSEGSQLPNQLVGLDDILNTVASFQGEPYPGDGPLDCP